jgi:hypothetical protein
MPNTRLIHVDIALFITNLLGGCGNRRAVIKKAYPVVAVTVVDTTEIINPR